jgi:polar amino acid transport system substrate-binding protein
MTRRTHFRRAAKLLLTGLLLASAAAGVPAVARADELASIKQAGVLAVGVFEDFPPFASAGTDMTLHGYDIDVAEALAASLGVKLKLVGITGQNRIPYLQEHKVNLLLSVGQNPEREKVIDFTDSYAPYYIALLGPKAMAIASPADLADKTVAVNRGTMEDTEITKSAPKSADIKRFDSYSGVIAAFMAGQVQTIVVGNDVGAAVLTKHPATEPEQKFQLMSSPDHIAVNKGEPAFKRFLNDAVAKMKTDGSLDKVSEKWLGKPLDPKDL